MMNPTRSTLVLILLGASAIAASCDGGADDSPAGPDLDTTTDGGSSQDAADGSVGSDAEPPSPWDLTMHRALVAVIMDGGQVHLGWRMSVADHQDLGFHVYRRTEGGQPERCNDEPVTATSDFVDTPPGDVDDYRWSVRPVMDDAEGPSSEEVTLAPGRLDTPFVSMTLDEPFAEVGVGDLDGDGRLDFVFKSPETSIDPYQDYWEPSPETSTLTARTPEGQILWEHDMGWSIEMGIWYSPYLVHDLDGDGVAEVIVKRGEGDPRDVDGRVTSGPEWLTVLDGRDGTTRAEAPWIPRDEFEDYNRASRNQLGIAYLDGTTAHVIVERGTYGRIQVKAFRLDGGALSEVWHYDNDGQAASLMGQGAHWMHSVDLDGDGRQEVIIGSTVLDDDGTVLWNTGFGHPDHVYVGDLDPIRPGWEVLFGIEPSRSRDGMVMVDAMTGEIVWGYGQPTEHIHFGLCGDLLGSEPGVESLFGERDAPDSWWGWNADGDLLTNLPPPTNEALPVYWDADHQHELAVGGVIDRIERFSVDGNGEVVSTELYGALRATFDLVGDWREEILTMVGDTELRIHTTNIPATDRRAWLMQDEHYRMQVTHSTSGYGRNPLLGRFPTAAP